MKLEVKLFVSTCDVRNIYSDEHKFSLAEWVILIKDDLHDWALNNSLFAKNHRPFSAQFFDVIKFVLKQRKKKPTSDVFV